MKYILFLSLVLSHNTPSYSQQEALDYEIRDNTYIIKPTFDNLVNLMFCSQSSFTAAMKVYRYTTVNNIDYYASNGAGKPSYSIKRNAKETVIYSEIDAGFISDFRDELRSLSSEISPIYRDGYEHYYISLTYDNIKRNVHIQMRANSYGGSIIGIILN